MNEEKIAPESYIDLYRNPAGRDPCGHRFGAQGEPCSLCDRPFWRQCRWPSFCHASELTSCMAVALDAAYEHALEMQLLRQTPIQGESEGQAVERAIRLLGWRKPA